jgi:hypothetical protein
VEVALEAMLPSEATAEAAHMPRSAVANVIVRSGAATARDVTSALAVRFQFIAASPAAVDAMRRMDLAAIRPGAR